MIRTCCWDSVNLTFNLFAQCTKLTCISAILSRIWLWLRYSDYCVGTVYCTRVCSKLTCISAILSRIWLWLKYIVLRLLCWDMVQECVTSWPASLLSCPLSRIWLWLRYSDYCVGTVYKTRVASWPASLLSCQGSGFGWGTQIIVLGQCTRVCSKLTCISAILSRIWLWLRYSDYCVGTVYKTV